MLGPISRLQGNTDRVAQGNNYFDAAFPRGQSQYTTFNNTCWATMALLQTIDSALPDPRRAGR